MRSSTILRILSVFVCLSLLENKTFEAVVFGEDVNYQDASGKWQPIDNRLIQTVAPDGSLVYQNKANGWTIRLSAKTGAGSLVSVEKNGKTVRWRMTGQKQDVVPDITTGMSDEEFAALSPGEQRYTTRYLHTKVTYRNLVEGCDVEYDIGPSGVRENVTFENRAEARDIVSEVETDGLTPSASRPARPGSTSGSSRSPNSSSVSPKPTVPERWSACSRTSARLTCSSSTNGAMFPSTEKVPSSCSASSPTPTRPAASSSRPISSSHAGAPSSPMTRWPPP